MSNAEPDAKSASTPKTGFFATLSSLLRGWGRGAPSPSRRPKLIALIGAALLASLVLGVSLAAGAPPTVTIEDASNVQFTTATAKGTVDPANHETSYHFEYATEADFSNASSAGFGSLPEGAGSTPVEAELTGLAPSTTYHLRLVAENSEGEKKEVEAAHTFTTKAVAKPTVTIEPNPAHTGTTAHFVGHVDPNSPEPEASTSAAEKAAFETHWRFSCTPSCPHEFGGELRGEVKADDTAHEVSAEATGLTPGEIYEVRLTATNAGGEETTGPVTFATPAIAPTIDSTAVSAVTPTEAKLEAVITPGGASTTYQFQYLTEAQFKVDGEEFGAGAVSTPETPAVIGHDDTGHAAFAELHGLAANANYRFRVIAHNSVKTEDSAAQPFYTYQSSPLTAGCPNQSLREENQSTTLPDCRAYELASPLTTSEEVYAPRSVGAENAAEPTARPFQASADGEAVIYQGDPPQGPSGGDGHKQDNNSQAFRATRTAAGWQAASVQPPSIEPNNDTPAVQAFSPDLSREYFSYGIHAEPGEQAFNAAAQPPGPAGLLYCDILYSRTSADGAFHALFTELPPNHPQVPCGEPLYAGASADGSQVFFQDEGALLPAAAETLHTNSTVPGCSRACNLYDNHAGHLGLINVLPGGSTTEAAVFGGLGSVGSEVDNPPGLSGAISQDGSRAYWTSVETISTTEQLPKAIYLRLNPSQEQSHLNGEECTEAAKACTVPVSGAGPAQFWAATPDGRYAYYTEAGALWRYDAQNQSREEIVPAAAEVQGLLGINQEGEDGSYLYLVAKGVLTGTERNEHGETAQAGQPNLYLLHAGQTKLVAVLSAADDHLDYGQFGENGSGGYPPQAGDWIPSLGDRTAQPSADGTSLVFASERHLTGYESGPPSSKDSNEVFVYDSASGRLSCASCAPTGTSPQTVESEDFTHLAIENSNFTHQPRFISADGSRVFFETPQPLLPSDTNGLTQDVYEWERPGAGSCTEASSLNGGGCLYLLSAGANPAAGASFFADASASGGDVFIVTRAQLSPADTNEQANFYDVREGGGFPLPSGSHCENAELCHEKKTEAPPAASPNTPNFNGPEEGPNHPQKPKKHHKKKHHKHHKKHKRASANRGGRK